MKSDNHNFNNILPELKEELAKRVLILDGAMGTMIQRKSIPDSVYESSALLRDTDVPLKGNNDILNLLCPEVIRDIHQSYVDAGADLITTNTFSSNKISQQEYGCGNYIKEMNKAGAGIARQVADACKERKIWVVGSVGPTAKSLSLASDINHPEERLCSFDDMDEAYQEQISSLIDGGVDIIMLETCFDALNTKAALWAVQKINKQRNTVLPVMISVTVNDRSGRTLTGQTLDAFYTSVKHYPVLSFGLNCSFGVTELRPFIENLSSFVNGYISIHPNAGLPNEMGEYEEQPEFTAKYIKAMGEAGLINIAGGCCGTTPEHIKLIADNLKGIKPRTNINRDDGRLVVSGLDNIVIDSELSGFVNVGERTNVAGSRKFARLIAEKKYEEAASVARTQIDNGAAVIDINMDDSMLDSREEMEKFVRYISNDPSVAKAAVMIDSSDWDTVVSGLKNIQGKSIVNSISLKNGEEDFLEKARQIKELGAAVVVMAFDEQGQATSYKRKIEICQRAYLLLQNIGYPLENVIFDTNILSVGTGISEHADYAKDFIEAVRWLKTNLPKVKTSGGVSNLSFAFRGNNKIREAMHSVFLYHAIKAGLDMAIVNASQIQLYDDIDSELRVAIENVILNKSEDASEVLLSLATKIKEQSQDSNAVVDNIPEWRSRSVEDRLFYALSTGNTEYLKCDIDEILKQYDNNAVAVIESPLMNCMEKIGKLFEEGKLFLPQIVKSAKVMKDAVAVLQPLLDEMKTDDTLNGESSGKKKDKVILATAKGDVHDIGKNIVSIVLSCNNLEIIDLGVMVNNELILETAKKEKPLFVGISGLITPSLKEMEDLCKLFEKENMNIPVLVGGATTSVVHTAVKLAPLYNNLVIYGGDASNTAVIAKKIQSDKILFTNDTKQTQEYIRQAYNNRNEDIIPYNKANANALKVKKHFSVLKTHSVENYNVNIQDIEKFIDWRMFLLFWGFRGESVQQILVNPEAIKTYNEAKQYLNHIKEHGGITVKALLKTEKVTKKGNDIVFEDKTVLPMLRSQSTRHSLSLVDFLNTDAKSQLGLFCVTAKPDKAEKDSAFDKLMTHALCARFAEAAVVWLQQQVYNKEDNVIRPAFGYAMCPDHSLKQILFERLDVEKKLDIHLTDNYSVNPSTSVCGMFVSHPEARYFSVGRIDEEQFEDYCNRRGFSYQEGEKYLNKNIVR